MNVLLCVSLAQRFKKKEDDVDDILLFRFCFWSQWAIATALRKLIDSSRFFISFSNSRKPPPPPPPHMT